MKVSKDASGDSTCIAASRIPPLRSTGSVRFQRVRKKIVRPSGWFGCSPIMRSTCGGVSAYGSRRSAALIACQIQGPALFYRALLFQKARIAMQPSMRGIREIQGIRDTQRRCF